MDIPTPDPMRFRNHGRLHDDPHNESDRHRQDETAGAATELDVGDVPGLVVRGASPHVPEGPERSVPPVVFG